MENINVKNVATVSAADLNAAGAVNSDICYNFMAGKVDKDIRKAVDQCTDRSSAPLEALLPNLGKNERTAIKKLCSVSAATIAKAWNAKMDGAKVQTTPRLQTLAAAVFAKTTNKPSAKDAFLAVWADESRKTDPAMRAYYDLAIEFGWNPDAA
jgi:hypothetical protein